MKRTLPRPRRRTALIVVSAAILVAAAAVVAVVVLNRPAADKPPFTLSTPLVFRPVLEVEYRDSCTGAELPGDESGTCYRLGEGMTVRQAREVREADLDGVEWALLVSLTPADGAAFAELTGRLAAEPDPRNQIALVVDGKIISTPAVLEPITGGEVQLTGGWSSREDVTAYVERLTP
ncbi:SecDF P1 head subdomain-containing protein [Planobispora longispora]|uniref:SecDF P1 head subdomain domain-containing protein n=1 Tax=Planobispora longispora TaxID=28887 RepID=A0A8J3W217_9ACTN|nr:hypothetical protein [Planobispora longispora]GIH73864.1 hypothetical protein Plo01_02930 [Planobispora longispora]